MTSPPGRHDGLIVARVFYVRSSLVLSAIFQVGQQRRSNVRKPLQRAEKQRRRARARLGSAGQRNECGRRVSTPSGYQHQAPVRQPTVPCPGALLMPCLLLLRPPAPPISQVGCFKMHPPPFGASLEQQRSVAHHSESHLFSPTPARPESEGWRPQITNAPCTIVRESRG
jgi:hypothetical protein